MPIPKHRFEERTAIVTGGSCGIGWAIALALLREGARVVVTSLEADVAEGEKAFATKGFTPLILAGDMKDESFAARVVVEALDRHGHVDHLVNNAFSFIAKSTDATREDWDRALYTGPVAYARMMSLVAESMAQTGKGSIVNVSSISAFIAQPKRWTYNAAKGAVHQLTRCAALDLAPCHIRVNSVSPGWTWTRENERAANGDRDEYEKLWGDFAMLQRMAQPDEIAAPVLFLLSDEASFITGTDLPVDGGYQGLGPEGLGKHTVIAGSR